MKRFLLFAPLIILAACQKTGSDGFTLQVSMDETSTKTVVGPRKDNGKYPTYWVDGDVISVNGQFSQALSGVGAQSSSATFHFAFKPADADVYNVAYPACGADGRVNLSGSTAPLVGYTYKLSSGVSLRSPTAMVRFLCKGSATITSLDIQSMNGEKLAGTFVLNKDASGAFDGEMSPAQDASSAFSIDYGSGLQAKGDGAVVLFSIPAGTYSSGLKGVLRDSEGRTMNLRFFKNGATVPAMSVCAFPPISYAPGTEFVFTTPDEFLLEGVYSDQTDGIEGMDAQGLSLPVSIKAATYNIWAPSARKKVMDEDSSVPAQRSWANSYRSVADMINWLDCDVIGIQEVTNMVYKTTITSPAADYDGNVHTLNSLVPDYSWVIYNAANTSYDSMFPNNTTKNGLGSTDAILYKSSVLTLESHGRAWLNGTRNLAPESGSWDKVGTNRPATWARFKHKKSGKEFVFITTHLDLPNAGTSEDPSWPQRRNATELIEWLAPDVCGDLPSIITGDMNVDYGDTAGNYAILVSGQWKDVYDIMKANGSLSYTEDHLKGTMNESKNETAGLSTWRPDHVLVYGFTPSYYRVAREKFATADGSLHWPSDHLPVKVILNF